MPLKDVVEYLCSPRCLPRTPGRTGGAAAREYLIDRLLEIGVEPKGEDGFKQPIPRIQGTNLISRIEGNGPQTERHVVVGAHYDACDPSGVGLPGAADNASGIAIVLEMAQHLVAVQEVLRRSVLLCLFDAEEPPYFMTPDMGSQWFVEHPTVPLDSIDLMVCLDLVGAPLGPRSFPPEVRDSVFVLGAELSIGTPNVLDSVPAVDGIRPRRLDNHIRPPLSDYHAFHMAGIPFLFYTIGRNRNYHQMSDTPDTLDFAKMSALVQHLVAAVETLSRRPEGAGRFDPEGVDDEATLRSIQQVTLPLAQSLPVARRFVEALEALLVSAHDGGLSAGERKMIARIVDEVEQGLAQG